jgi:hypothetical protein
MIEKRVFHVLLPVFEFSLPGADPVVLKNVHPSLPLPAGASTDYNDTISGASECGVQIANGTIFMTGDTVSHHR